MLSSQHMHARPLRTAAKEVPQQPCRARSSLYQTAGHARDGLFSFETAWRTLQGYEAMNMLRKGQIVCVEIGDSMKQVTFIASLFGVAV